jgi:hypothetical protein
MSGGYKATSALWANTFPKTKHEVSAQSLPEALGASRAARRSSAIGEKPDESERSSQSGERGARSHDPIAFVAVADLMTVVQIVNDTQGGDDMCDHDGWISYSH